MTETRHDEGPAWRRALAVQESRAFLVYSAFAIASAVGIGVPALLDLRDGSATIRDVVTWVALCGIANVLPVPLTRNAYLSMSSAPNTAVAYLYSPGLAAAIVFVGALSEWELKGETSLLHAVFNRSQLALATAAMSWVFSLGPGDAPPPWLAALGTLVYPAANVLLVALAERTARRVRLRSAIVALLPKGLAPVTAYVALGLLGIVLALTYVRIGLWAVVVLTVPIVAARYALRTAKELETIERDRRMLADRLIDERERERTRIASDIHDGVLQQLAALQMEADNVGSALGRGDVEQGVVLAEGMKSGMADAILELRGAIANLRRVALDEDGLVPTLERYGRSFHARTGIPVQVAADGVPSDDIPLPLGILLFECCQEALTNVARHAGATTARLELATEGAMLRMRIVDDGIGISARSRGAGLGLELTRDKVTLAGGGFWVEPGPEKGTSVTVRLPMPAAR